MKQRDVVHPYLLRGIVRCDLCGRKMQGSTRRSSIAGAPTRVLYRCEFGARQSVPVGMDHPPTVYVREDAIVSRLDAWLAEIVSPEAHRRRASDAAGHRCSAHGRSNSHG